MNDAVGVLGLGLMGRPIAINLARSGQQVHAWNRREVVLSAHELDPPGPGRLRCHDDLAEVGRRCPVVLSLLPDLGPLEELLPTLLRPGHRVQTVVVMSTVSPIAVAGLAARLLDEGIDVVDAPMSGGVSGATAATLSIMMGGRPTAVERVRSLLECVGTTVVHLGAVGAGSLTKACNQMVVAGTLAALSEAVVLAERSGLDRGTVLEVLSGGLAASEVLRQKRHALVTDDFTATGPARYLLKDLTFARDAAAARQTTLPQLEVLATLFDTLVRDGAGDQDAAVLLDVVRRHSLQNPSERPCPSCTSDGPAPS